MKTLFVGLIILVVGIIITIIGGKSFWDNTMGMLSNTNDFVVPGEMVVTASNPGPLMLIDKYKTTFEGTEYNNNFDLPDDLVITMTASDGSVISMMQETRDQVPLPDGSEVAAVGMFELPAAGDYSIDVQFTGEPRVFGATKDMTESGMAILQGMGGACVGIVLAGIGFIVAIVGLIMKVTAKKEEPQDYYQPGPM